MEGTTEEKTSHTPNPYPTSGFFNKLLFTWMFPLFYKGYRTGLTEHDIYTHLKSHDSRLLGDHLEKEWNKELQRNPKDPSLGMVYFRMFGKEMMLYGLGYIMFEWIRLTQPLILSKLLEYFTPQSGIRIKDAYIYAALLSATTLICMILIHHAVFHIMHLGMRLKVASIALIYRKAMRLRKSAMAQTTVGQMVNLVSNDVARFEQCTIFAHDLWLGPLQLIILVLLLYWYAGWTGMVGLLVLGVVVPIQIWMAKRTSVYRMRTASRTDERIHIMNEIITGIQVIKIYTWEKPFIKLVESMRRLEMNEIRKNSIIKWINFSFNLFITRTATYLCILAYVLTGNTLNSQYVFGLTLIYELIRQNFSHSFTQGISQIAEGIISTRRIRKFLLYDELEPEFALQYSLGNRSISIKNVDGEPIGVHLKNVSAKWIDASTDYVLTNIDLDISLGELVAVVGKIGSGKSTLLHLILKELSPIDGSVKINGRLSYASQEPWLFLGSVRQNILFGELYDPVKYYEVVKVCALERDFKLFPHEDRTIIGERGVSLSGGQKARINLARAIYRDADIYLLDDPLSAVDAAVGKQIFNQCIKGYLKEKCVVLVTHQLQYLKDCKKIYLLNDGIMEYSGSYHDMANSGGIFTKFLEEMQKIEEESKKDDEERKRKRTMSTNRDSICEATAEVPRFAEETKIEGKVTWKMYKSYFLAGCSGYMIAFVIFIFIFSQALASGIDYFLSIWVNIEEMKIQLNTTQNHEYNESNLSGSQYTMFERFCFRVLTEEMALYVYTALTVILGPLIIMRGIIFCNYCIRASINLHNNMFSKIVYAPMRFFNLNPSGRVLNRFSKDMNLIDEYLPTTFSDAFQIGLMMLSLVVVVAVVVPFILLPVAIIAVLFYLLRVVFIATSRDIKRFEAITRSPVYSHLTASLQGLTTIRAYKAQSMVQKEFDNYQDNSSASFFMFMAANRTFGYWLDINTWIFSSLVTFSFLVFDNGLFGGSVGLAISQTINLAGWFQWGMRQWSEMENSMTSVERVKEYADVIPETDQETKELPSNWPEMGAIKFLKLYLRYAPEEPAVLQDLNFSIQPKEKIGIVGRTGAGKSSMITALFRLAETDGTISIDDIDTKSVSLNRLRSSISIIPQEPVLFSGSLRKNLDPFDNYSDEVLWTALEQVQLKKVVSEWAHGLESKMSEGGSNFSIGQRQLICLARALIRKNKILVMDEATANVDPHTDNLIQTTIRQKFVDCTVLTIAHRLATVIDSDKILVMDSGRVVEFDQPHILLEKKGVFFGLVEQAGNMGSNLRDFAKEAYSSRNKEL